MRAVPIDAIRTLEALAHNAWQPAENVGMDGWLLRLDAGVTRRANCVWPRAWNSSRSLLNAVEAVERYFAAHVLPARFQISPAAQPRDLDGLLARRGYGAEARFQVQNAAVSGLLDRNGAALARRVTFADRPSAEWLSTYCEAEQLTLYSLSVVQAILLRNSSPAAFVLVEEHQQPVATALGILAQGWVGIFCVATRLAFRRRGYATAAFRALAEWGREQGAANLYLQVGEDNEAACSLYQRLGFALCYRYHYREKALADASAPMNL